MGDSTVKALNDVTLTIESGDFIAIMGPSGSGKSTLMHVIGLLDAVDSGEYWLNGKRVSDLSDDEIAIQRRNAIGFVFQQFNLLPRLTAAENVALPLLYSQKKINYELSHKLLDIVGLGTRKHHRPNELSGGQQQRVAIARSLINQPLMVLADEPTGNLDSVSKQDIMSLLKELNSQGITVVLVTHEDEIGTQAKRLIRMRDGKVQSDERLQALKNSQDSNAKSPNANKGEARDAIAELWEHLRQGFNTLAANKIRTALSMLGILIGVAAVVAMLALGTGAKKAIADQLASLGSNLLVLRSGAVRVGGVSQEAGSNTRLDMEDAQAIKNQIPLIRDAAPNVNGKAQITYRNKNWNTQILGTTPAYVQIRSAKPESGRFFTEHENKKRALLVVIGVTVVKELFDSQSPIGAMIKINKTNFQVIGILPEKGANGYRDQDDIVVIPALTAMHRLLGKDNVDSIDLEVKDADSIEEAQDSILDFMNKRKKIAFSQQEGAFQIRNMAEIQSALSESSQTMSLLLASIAAISLLVGGIGIMNIMLISVTERTKEIGLRKAIGARRRDIMYQFLSESVVVSVVGGLAGIILGWVMTITLSYFSGWTTAITLNSVLLSFFYSVFTGLIFGLYPAHKASSLHPIEALRFE